KNRVVEILRDPTLARENFDMLTYHAAEIAGSTTLAKSAERAELVTAWQAALDRFSSDANLSRADRLAALDAKVALAKLDAPEGSLPEPLLENIRAQAALADRETRDPYARQAVIDAAAELLADAGLMQESDALLA